MKRVKCQLATSTALVMACACVVFSQGPTYGLGLGALDPRVCSPAQAIAKKAFLALPVPIPSGIPASDPAAADVADHHYVEMFDGKFVCGDSAEHFGAVVAAYKAAFAHPRNGTKPPLVLHFHGGLVSGEGAFNAPVERDSAMWKSYTKFGFPVFFMWHSGAGEIGAREVLPQNGHITTAHGLVNRWDFINESAAERERNGTGHPDFDLGRDITAPERVNLREEQLRHENLVNGANMWRHMEREISAAMERKGDRGGYLMVKAIAELAADPDFRVVLIGHSMGTIFASRLIESYAAYVEDHPELPSRARDFKFDLVFLAPAVKYRDFDRALRTKKIANFRMFTLYDRCERIDHLARGQFGTGGLKGLDDLYPRSLLYWISAVTSEYPDIPLVGMHRFMEDPVFNDNVLVHSVNERMIEFGGPRLPPSAFDRSIVLSPTKANGGAGNTGFETGSISHGGFDGDAEVLTSLEEIVNHGFTPSGAATPHPTATPHDAKCGDNENKVPR
jgi:hypothetical protein